MLDIYCFSEACFYNYLANKSLSCEVIYVTVSIHHKKVSGSRLVENDYNIVVPTKI